MTQWKWKKNPSQAQWNWPWKNSGIVYFIPIVPSNDSNSYDPLKTRFYRYKQNWKNLLITLRILRPSDGLWLWQLWQIRFHWILRNWIVRGISIFYGTLCTSYYSNSALSEYQSNGIVITVPLLTSSPCTTLVLFMQRDKTV